jgi:CcmD family protein
MRLIKKTGLAVMLTLLALQTFAQAQNNDNAVDAMMKSNGKIYVVIAVVLVIFIGLFVYLFRLDKKITRLEKDIKQKA